MLDIDVLSRLPPPRPYCHQAPHGRLRQLNRRCGPLTGATSAQIQALSMNQLEALAVGAAFSAGVARLDFQGPNDLTAWLAANG